MCGALYLVEILLRAQPRTKVNFVGSSAFGRALDFAGGRWAIWNARDMRWDNGGVSIPPCAKFPSKKAPAPTNRDESSASAVPPGFPQYAGA